MLFFAVIVLLAVLAAVFAGSPRNVVASVRGKPFNVQGSTVDEIIQQVEVQAGLETGSQHVLFRGKILNASDNLEDLGINDGDVLAFVKRRRVEESASSSEPISEPEEQSSFTDEQSEQVSSSSPVDQDEAYEAQFKAFKKSLEAMTPDEVQRMKTALEQITDSANVNTIFADDDGLERLRLQMLANIDTYEKSLPGFQEQTKDILNDTIRWREAMYRARKQFLMIRSFLDYINSIQGSQSGSSESGNDEVPDSSSQ